MSFSNIDRKGIINKLKAIKFDLLVIGGGITGAGVALDATARGIKTALVEMQDFAAGTSSRSTKLVHGGLRYLKQFEVKMVAEVGKERAVVYENGPHVTTPEWMLLPIHKGGTFGKASTSIGLRVYDFLAGVRKSERRKMLGVAETLKREPLIKKSGLKGSGYYVEYRTDDSRLTIEVIKAAVDRGAIALNYSKVEDFLYEKGKLIGVIVVDQLSGQKYEIYADKVVNAAGPWVDEIREKDHSKNGKTLKLSKGVHLVVDQEKFPLKQAIYFDTPDGRMVFAIPRDGKAYVGTTDTFYKGNIARPTITREDRNYIMNAINYMFPEINIKDQDIESSWAGVRPLILEEGKNPSEISRKDEIWESESGMITIAGGKLTGYRKMAETIVDSLVSKFKTERKVNLPKSPTKTLPISGGDVGGANKFNAFIAKQIVKGVSLGLTNEDTKHLASIYGSNVPRLFNIIETQLEKAQKYKLPVVLFAKLQYAIDYEMIATPVDFFNRRTGAILFDISSVKKYKNQVIQLMSDHFNWSTDFKKKMENELKQELIDATTPIEEQENIKYPEANSMTRA